MKKNALIFTYYFPPAGGVAVQRFLKFSKYLPQFGWEPIIVTVKDGSYPYYDETLLKQVPPSLRVYRTNTTEPFGFYNFLRGKKGKALPIVAVGAKKERSVFQKISEYIRANYFIPDARVGWVKHAVKQAEEILAKEKIHAIITTGPPHSTHLTGLALKKKYKLPWLADFRDPWTGIFYNEMLPRTEATKKKDHVLEAEVLQNADAVTVIGPGMKKHFAGLAKEIDVIFNGYDEEDFLAVSSVSDRPSSDFTIRYVGNLMASQDVKSLWQAIAATKENSPGLKLELIGRVDAEVKTSIAEHGLSEYVIYRDFIPHNEAIRAMKSAQVLLFIIPNVHDNKLIVTGKLLEYIATGNEILAIGPVDGDAAAILQMAGKKPMTDYNAMEEIKQQVETAYFDWKNHYTLAGNATLPTKEFSRKSQAGLLAGILNRIAG